ncbi:MAG: glycosyl hydrolase family protein [Verrucomicrobia bacterium]|jgi:beta-glucanase (GH16 family)|nr:MAG: glycosyl hydrolase family protein [Verrucomicrobiota bacterium]
MKQLLSLLALTATLGAVNPASNMKLAFSDEFDGPALDASKWATYGEPTAMSFVTVGKSKALRITLIKKEDMIQTNGIRSKFEQVRGYFEASIRFNTNTGHTGNMSIRGKDDKVVPYILALWEGTGDDYLAPWARYLDDNGQHDLRSDASGKKILKGGEPSKKFNTYGILWTEKGFTWYVNGKQIHKVDRIAIAAPMTVQFTHRIAEYERPKLVLKQLPDDVDIDWVKVWK